MGCALSRQLSVPGAGLSRSAILNAAAALTYLIELCSVMVLRRQSWKSGSLPRQLLLPLRARTSPRGRVASCLPRLLAFPVSVGAKSLVSHW